MRLHPSFIRPVHSDGQTQQMPACQNFAPPLCFPILFIVCVCVCVLWKEGKLLQRMWFLMSYLENEHPHDTLASDFYASGFMCWRIFLSDHCSKLNISVHQILLWNQTCGCWWIPALPARSSTTRLMLTWGLCVNLLRKAKLGSWRPNVPWQQSSRCFPAMMVLSRGSWCNQFLLSTRYTLTAHSHSIMQRLFLFAAATLLC